MDKFQFQPMSQQSQFQETDLANLLNQAKQNPKAFEEHVRRTNPQGYQRAIQIRNSMVNPQQAVMQMAQQRGINPNIIRMLDV